MSKTLLQNLFKLILLAEPLLYFIHFVTTPALEIDVLCRKEERTINRDNVRPDSENYLKITHTIALGENRDILHCTMYDGKALTTR